MTDPLLRIVDLKTHFQTKGAGLFGEKKVIMAVDGVSFDIARGDVPCDHGAIGGNHGADYRWKHSF